MKNLVKTFKALSDPNRIRILKMLEVRPLCVCEISQVLRLAASTVSKHLSILRDAGLIRDEKEGKWVNYLLNSRPDNAYAAQLQPLIRQWLPDDATIRSDRDKVTHVDRNTLCSV